MSGKAKYILRIAALFALLLIPIFYALATAIDLEHAWIKKIAYLTVVIVMLLLPALILKARTYFIAEGVFNFFFFPIDIVSLYLNRQSASVPFVQNILHTDFHESLELLISIWPLCLCVVALWLLYFILAVGVENHYLISGRGRKVIAISAICMALIGYGTMVVYQKRVYPSKPGKIVMRDAVDLVWMKLYKIYPYNLYMDLADIIQSHRQQRQMQVALDDFRFGIKPCKQDSPSLYILVIGEAARYDHWSLNGYARETSPRLRQRIGLISFDSVYAQANLTSYSLPLIITRATARNADLAYREKTLPEAFREAGFYAGLITQQPPSSLVSRSMNACDMHSYHAENVDIAGHYDAQMIDPLRAHIQDTMQFFLLHSLGCHFRYELRYPASFACFQPVIGNTSGYAMIAKENKEPLINAYDNAILYTDYFLNELIAYADSLNRPAVVLYISDHGESFWDDERNLSLHGSYVLSEYEYHVPMFIWYSNEYAALYPDKVKILQQNKTTPISSDVVFYSMLDLAGIPDIVDSTRSICSPFLSSMDTIYVHSGSGEIVPMAIH